MKTVVSILSVGDVHGRDEWSVPTFGGMREFYEWLDGSDRHYPFMDFDYIVFVGDYVDSYNLSNVQILHNLKNVIAFKKACPDKVVLLVGNHDIQYIHRSDYSRCKGYRAEAYWDVFTMFTDNLGLFQMAFEHGDWMWTHAGVTRDFYDNCMQIDPSHKFYKVMKDMGIAEMLNFMLETNDDALYNVGRASHGSSDCPSPIWARPEELDTSPMWFNQVVGHTWHNNIVRRKMPKTGLQHIYVDCFGSGEWHIHRDS